MKEILSTPKNADLESMEERAARTERAFREAEKPILNDLIEVGVEVQSIFEFMNMKSYPKAIPVLLRHLTESYPSNVKGIIGRALACPEAKYAWNNILLEYVKTSDSTESSAKQGLAVALAANANDSVLDEIIGLLTDIRHGASRGLLLNVLKKSKRLDAQAILTNLANDPDLSSEIKSWKAYWKKRNPAILKD